MTLKSIKIVCAAVAAIMVSSLALCEPVIRGGHPLPAISRVSTPEVVARLQNVKLDVRAEAAYELGRRLDNAAIPSLVLALNDPEVSVRVTAGEALLKLGDQRGTAALVKALDADGVFDEFWVLQAAMILAERGNVTGAAIIKQNLTRTKGMMRCFALIGMEFLPGGAPYEVVAKGLDDQYMDVRMRAIRIARERKSSQYYILLRSRVDQVGPVEKQLIIMALAADSSDENVELLIQKLADSDVNVRRFALRSLSSISGRPTNQAQVESAAKAASTRQKWEQWFNENRKISTPPKPSIESR
ncbi:MAG: HEAT repeat domain-containing protein [Armatimonadota bacterium]